MHTTRTTTAAVLAVGLLLTACTSSDEEPADPAPSSTAAKDDKPAEPSPTAEPHGLGDSADFTQTLGDLRKTVTLTALAYTQPVTGITSPQQPGEEWAQLEAELCTKHADEQVTASQFPWSLAFADGTRVKVTGLHGGDFPRPEYPMDAVVAAGDCAKGLMQFPVPKGERPDRVVYQPTGSANTIEWTVPTK